MTPRDITNPRISPLHLAVQAFRVTFGGVDTILRLSWLAALLLSLTQIFSSPVTPTVTEDGTELMIGGGDLAYFVLMAILSLGVQGMVAIGWHRALLLGETHDERRFYLRFGRSELAYTFVAVAMLLFFAMGLGMLPAAMEMAGGPSFILAIFFLAGPILATLVVSRISLVLVMLALGKPADLKECWEATKGNGARLAALYLMVGVPMALCQFLLPVLLGRVASLGLGIIGDIVVSFIGTLVLLLVFCALISAISLAYRELITPKPVM